MKIKVGACLIQVACIPVKYPFRMHRTNKEQISQLGLLCYFLYLLSELEGDLCSLPPEFQK